MNTHPRDSFYLGMSCLVPVKSLFFFYLCILLGGRSFMNCHKLAQLMRSFFAKLKTYRHKPAHYPTDQLQHSLVVADALGRCQCFATIQPWNPRDLWVAGVAQLHLIHLHSLLSWFSELQTDFSVRALEFLAWVSSKQGVGKRMVCICLTLSIISIKRKGPV